MKVRVYIAGMFKNASVILLSIACCSSACRDSGPKDDVSGIRETYAAYLNALRVGDGDRAAALVDDNTLAYYDKMLELARNADSTEVSRLDVMDKITVLGLRLQAGDKGLHALKARDAIAMSSAMLGGEELEALELGNITVNGDKASAALRMGGFPVPAKFQFQRDGDAWKIDITPLFTLSRMAFDQMALRSGIPTNEWLMQMLESSSGERPSDAIWHP